MSRRRDATDRENFLNTFLLALAVVLLLTPLFLAPSPLWAFLLWGGLLAVLVLIAEMFLWRFPLGIVRAPPDRVLAYLARQLRITGHSVQTGEGEFSVRIGDGAIVRIRAADADGGSKLAYQADATLAGWLSIAALPFIFRRVRAWARDRLVPLVPTDGILPEPGPRDEVKAVLLDALSEAHQMATEAYEAERERYRNSQGIVGLGAILAWFLLFLGMSLTSPEPDVTRRMTTAASLAFVLTLAVALPGAWLLRRRRRDRLLRARVWVDRLQEALAREAASAGVRAEGTSSFELLLETSPEVPQWLEATRRAGMSHDPAAWFLVFVMVWIGLETLLFYAPSFAAYGLAFGILVVLLGVGILAGAYVVYKRWQRRRDEALERMRAEWNSRYERLRGEMERYLEGL